MRLTINNLLDSLQVFQALTGEIIITVPPLRTVQTNVSTAQLESLQDQLERSKAQYRIDWSVVDDSPGGKQSVAGATMPNRDTVALELGMAVSAWDGGFIRARCDSEMHANVQGLVTTRGDLTLPTRAQTTGNIVFGANTWADVVEESGGLQPGHRYFLAMTPGKITATPPTMAGCFLCPLGTALSTTTFSFNALLNIMQ